MRIDRDTLILLTLITGSVYGDLQYSQPGLAQSEVEKGKELLVGTPSSASLSLSSGPTTATEYGIVVPISTLSAASSQCTTPSTVTESNQYNPSSMPARFSSFTPYLNSEIFSPILPSYAGLPFLPDSTQSGVPSLATTRNPPRSSSRTTDIILSPKPPQKTDSYVSPETTRSSGGQTPYNSTHFSTGNSSSGIASAFSTTPALFADTSASTSSHSASLYYILGNSSEDRLPATNITSPTSSHSTYAHSYASIAISTSYQLTSSLLVSTGARSNTYDSSVTPTMSSTSHSDIREVNATTSPSRSSASAGSATLSASTLTATGNPSTSSKSQSPASGNSTAAPSSEIASKGASSQASQTQSATDKASSATSGKALTQTQYVVTTVTASDGPSGLVTFTTTVEATPSTGESEEATTTNPSQTDSSPPQETSVSHVAFPPAYVYDAVIDGTNYHLPAPDEPPMTIILASGTLAELSNDQVKIGTETISLADFSDSRTIEQGGTTYVLGKVPGVTKKPQGGGGGGGKGGLGGLFGGLTKAAKGAVNGVSQARKDVLSMATSAASSSWSAVANTLSSASKEVNDLVSSINGIQQSLPADKLTKAGLDKVLSVQNLGRQASNWLTSTANLVKDLPEGLETQVFENIKEFAKERGPLAQAEKALAEFGELEWKSEMSQSQIPTATREPSASATERPSGTSMSTETASQESSQDQTTTKPTSSSTHSSTVTSLSTSSGTPSATSTDACIIYSKDGTSSKSFKDFTKELDEGAGRLWSWDIMERHMYLTNLTSKQIEELPKNHTFIKFVDRASKIDEQYDGSVEEHLSVGSQRQSSFTPFETDHGPEKLNANGSALRPRAMVTENNAHWWKKMLSAHQRDRGKSVHDLSYVADDTGGIGTTIYVLDDGFDVDSGEIDAGGRSVDHVCAPNILTLRSIEESRRLPEDIRTGGVHGTMMAIIAAGKTYGIAPNANLFLAKTKNNYRNRFDEAVTHVGGVQKEALMFIFGEIEQHIRLRMDPNKGGDVNAKSVINMSWGQSLTAGGTRLDDAFKMFLEFCRAYNVPVVISAGNQPSGSNLHSGTPQHLGVSSLEDILITVGAVKKDGTLWEDTAVPEPGEEGSMTVYAPGELIKVPTVGGEPPDERSQSGTSHAAAITSGLVAYLFAAPYMSQYVFRSTFSMKALLVNNAWTRVNPPIRVPNGWPRINSLDVIYNLARDDRLCVEQRDAANGTDAHCTFPVSREPSASATKRPSGTSRSTESRTASKDQTTESVSASTKSSASFSTTSAQNGNNMHETPTTSSTTASITTNSSSTSSADLSSTKVERYWIRTKDGTSLKTFEHFIRDLDNATGKVYITEFVPWQSYMTKLTSEQAKDLKSKHDFILTATSCAFRPSDIEADEEFRALSKRRNETWSPSEAQTYEELAAVKPFHLFEHLGIYSRAYVLEDPNAPYWKKMISAPPRSLSNGADPPYKADDRGGKGTNVYIIDDGFDMQNQDELAPTDDRRVQTHVIPNEITVPDGFLENTRKIQTQAVILDENINNGRHGTKMAIITAGKTRGVAPKANLYLMKGKASWAKKKYDKFLLLRYQLSAIDYALMNIRGLIMKNRLEHPDEKDVVQLSWGIEYSQHKDAREMYFHFQSFFDWCKEMDIPVVLAAGNTAETSLDEKVPQSLGTDENTVITVGGVTRDGNLWNSTSPAYSGRPGSMTVFAPAVGIDVPGDPELPNDGTSQAAAIVGGLAAYLYSIRHAVNMKELIVNNAWVRARPKPQAADGWPPQINVIYNLAGEDPAHEDDPCAVGYKAKRDISSALACSKTKTARPSTSAKTSRSASTKAVTSRHVTKSKDVGSQTTKNPSSSSEGGNGIYNADCDHRTSSSIYRTSTSAVL